MIRDNKGKFIKGDQNQGAQETQDAENHTFITLLNRPPSTLVIMLLILLVWAINYHGSTIKKEFQAAICSINNETPNTTPIINDTPGKPKEK